MDGCTSFRDQCIEPFYDHGFFPTSIVPFQPYMTTLDGPSHLQSTFGPFLPHSLYPGSREGALSLTETEEVPIGVSLDAVISAATTASTPSESSFLQPSAQVLSKTCRPSYQSTSGSSDLSSSIYTTTCHDDGSGFTESIAKEKPKSSKHCRAVTGEAFKPSTKRQKCEKKKRRVTKKPNKVTAVLRDELPPHSLTKERNRIATSKCRQKKKAFVQNVETDREKQEKKFKSLCYEYEQLVDEVALLKECILSHAGCNDPRIEQWIGCYVGGTAV
jgi:hypothetical protein